MEAYNDNIKLLEAALKLIYRATPCSDDSFNGDPLNLCSKVGHLYNELVGIINTMNQED
jgi:hypothetical protein